MLPSITGSRARAAILIELFGDDPRHRSISDLARAAGIRPSAAAREVRRLVASGLAMNADPARRQGARYRAGEFPGHLELRRFVLATHGHAARIRAALAPLDPRQLAWVHGRYAQGQPIPRQIRVAVICREPRDARARLGPLADGLGYQILVDAMRISESVVRLQKREMRVIAIRRAPRLWLIGDDEQLRRREHSEAQDRAALKAAIANWREELSDEWDEDYDPFKRPY